MTITEFINARIEEDEEAARRGAGEPAYWHYGDTAAEESVEMAKGEGCAEAGYRHLRRWLPARVLAECEAKRHIVAHHTASYDDPDGWCYICADDGWPCLTLRALALPFADHPDFDPAWRM